MKEKGETVLHIKLWQKSEVLILLIQKSLSSHLFCSLFNPGAGTAAPSQVLLQNDNLDQNDNETAQPTQCNVESSDRNIS